MKKLLLSLLLIGGSALSYAQVPIWSAVPRESLATAQKVERASTPLIFHTFSINQPELENMLVNTPLRNSGQPSNVLISFPTADGKMENFRIYEAPVLHPDLGAQHPNIKSYVGRGIENPATTIRFSTTIFGVHAIIMSDKGTQYIDPYTADLQNYIVYKKSNVKAARTFHCSVNEPALDNVPPPPPTTMANDGLFRTYRLALACTIEYAAYQINAAGVGAGTLEQKKAAVLAAMTVTMTRVNGVFEKDMSLTMQIVPNNENIIFVTSDNLQNNDEGTMIDQIQPIINRLPWMAQSTRDNAIKKLRKLTVKIGYPDKWKDYSALTIQAPKDGGTFFGNMKNVSRWRWQRDLEKLGRAVDKTEWGMAPQIVNAYFNPSNNEIVFPAGILQPPFYDYRADEAVNYGGIGAVIGHEISHGFDDSGSRYNADGNLVNWWSDEDLAQFTGLGGALADQYSALQPLPGIYVDGKFTLGENIGDLGGVNAAYDGLLLHLKKNGNPGLIDGFTPQQRFFISWATIWRTKMRDEAIKNQVKTDPHSPGMYRAYVPLQNVDAFYEAFGIKEGDKMYVAPDKRVKIW